MSLVSDLIGAYVATGSLYITQASIILDFVNIVNKSCAKAKTNDDYVYRHTNIAL